MKKLISLLTIFSFSVTAGLPPTSSKISGESSFATTFQTDFGSLTGTRSGTKLTPSQTGTGSMVLSTSPTLVTPNLGTPSTLIGTNITGTASGLTAGNVTTNANLTGAVVSTGNATSLGSFGSANLAAALSDETGTNLAVFSDSPVLVTPNLGTPSTLVGTNITGTASGLTAGNVTTNANLTGAVTSTGNATSLGSFGSANLAAALSDETGNNKAVFSDSPVLVTPNLGTPSAATLTNATGLPVSTGISGLATGVAIFLATPNSLNLATAVTNETGSGALVFATSPALVTPDIGVATGSSLALGGALGSTAILDVQSTTKGILPPRMTTTQRDAISSPVAGLTIYNTTTNTLNTYNGTLWMGAAQSADTDWAACTFSTLAWQGLGSVTNTSLQCRRQGPNLEMKGAVTLGTVTASTAQFLLPNNYGTIVTQSTTTNESYGLLVRSANSVPVVNALSTVSSGYFQVSNGINTTFSNTPQAGNVSFLTGDTVNFSNVKIPITGWTTNTGSFSGVAQVPGGGSIDTFTVSYGTTNATTACSASPCSYLDQIGTAVSSITRASTGTYSLNTVKTYLKLKCVAGNLAVAGSARFIDSINCSSCNTATFTSVYTSNAVIDTYGTLYCQGSY